MNIEEIVKRLVSSKSRLEEIFPLASQQNIDDAIARYLYESLCPDDPVGAA